MINPDNVYNKLYNHILVLVYRRKINKMIKVNKFLDQNLSKGYKRDCKGIWGNFASLNWHKAYQSVNKIEDIRYVPEDVFYSKIEPRLNNFDLVQAYSDKNNLKYFFPDIKIPSIIIKNQNGYFFDEKNNLIDATIIENILKNQNGKYVIKPSIDSGGGRNVNLFSIENRKIILEGQEISFSKLTQMYDKDFNIQKAITQNESLRKFHPESLNTVRIMTYRNGNNIAVLSAIVRFGNNGSDKDNQAVGGLSCGIGEHGKLKEFAIDKSGNKYKVHPYTKVEFSGNLVPNYKSIIETVKSAHEMVRYFDLVSWDIAIDEHCNPILIELNNRSQEINFHQFNNGPLFGKYTDDVLKKIS